MWDSASEGSSTRVEVASSEAGWSDATAAAQTTPVMGMDPPFKRASEAALIDAATNDGEKRSVREGVRDWITSWMSVLGLRDRMMDGASRPLNDAARALDSVPGSDDSGLTLTSMVALDGCSAASRTSIGPETEARASISPNPNRADPSTLASLS